MLRYILSPLGLAIGIQAPITDRGALRRDTVPISRLVQTSLMYVYFWCKVKDGGRSFSPPECWYPCTEVWGLVSLKAVGLDWLCLGGVFGSKREE